MQYGGVGAGLDLLAQRRIAEQFGDLGEDFQVLLRRRFRHQQEDEQVDRLLVGRIETDRMAELEQCRHRRLQALDAAMRNRDAMAQPGGAETLAREQAVGDERAGQAVQVFEQQPGFLECALLAGCVDAHKNLGRRQDGRETVHGRGRAIGEGTNKSLDLDGYDIYYSHLFIWDNETKMVVGAYRIGKGDEIFYSYGKEGFYTAELFKIKSQFYPVLKNSLELGRSWIRKEYQQKPLPLFLLWKGILKYLIDNPKYRYLIGPVSISNSFSKFSKSLIVDFIYKNHFDQEMAQMVKPRKKFKVNFSKIDVDILTANNSSLKSLDHLINEIETSHIKVPVLLRQYIALNAKIICFNIDPKFSDCLDGFLVLDLENVPQDMLDKLSKNL